MRLASDHRNCQQNHLDLAPQKIPLLEAETAETALRRLGSRCPGYEAKSWNGLGLLKKRLGRYEEAEQAYRQAMKLDRKFVDIHGIA